MPESGSNTWSAAKAKAGRIFYWLLFSVFFGALPLGFSALDEAYHNQPIRLLAVIGKGELLIIACGLAGASLGDLMYLKSKRRLLKSAIGVFALSVVATSTFLFGLISEDLRNNAAPAQIGVTFSLWAFGIALLVGVMTVVISDDGTL